MVNYTKLAATAERLVRNSGRAVVLSALETVPSDAAKPWRGNTEPRELPVNELTVSAVFVAPSALGFTSKTDGLFSTAQQICIIATTEDITMFNEVVDTDGLRWAITNIEKLKPGDTTLLYYVGVKR